MFEWTNATASDEIVATPRGTFWVEVKTPNGILRKLPVVPDFKPSDDDLFADCFYPDFLRYEKIDWKNMEKEQLKAFRSSRIQYWLDNQSKFPEEDVEKEREFLKTPGLILTKSHKKYSSYFSGKWQNIVCDVMEDNASGFDTTVRQEDLIHAILYPHPAHGEEYVGDDDKHKPEWMLKKNIKQAINALILKGAMRRNLDETIMLNVVHIPCNLEAKPSEWKMESETRCAGRRGGF